MTKEVLQSRPYESVPGGTTVDEDLGVQCIAVR
jgi:hypothetical protein